MRARRIGKSLIAVVVLARYLILIVAVVLAGRHIPFSHDFTYKAIPAIEKIPHWLGVWANFDGEHYIYIAMDGYHQFDKAFFPLYPIILRLVREITGTHYILSGFILSNVLLIVSVFVLYKLISEIYKVKRPVYFVTLLLAYPAAFFFSAVYTESLLLFLTVLALYTFYKKKGVLSGCAAALTSLTRLQGIFLVFPLFFATCVHAKPLKENILHAAKNLLIYTPLFGLALYMGYMYIKTGDPLYFRTVQPLVGSERSSSIILLPQVYVRYFKILFSTPWNFHYFVAFVEVGLFSFSFLLTAMHLFKSFKTKNNNEMGIASMSLFHLVLPTLTGTFSSMPRYALFVWSPFFIMSNAKPALRYVVLLIFIFLQVVLLAYFSQGYFVG